MVEFTADVFWAFSKFMVEGLISRYGIILSLIALVVFVKRRFQAEFESEFVFLRTSFNSLLDISIMSVLLDASDGL